MDAQTASASVPEPHTGVRRVFRFEDAEGDRPDLFGGKAAGLARMKAADLPVPPGFVITTAACREAVLEGGIPPGLADEVFDHVSWLEQTTGRAFGAGPSPLLVSVRSGAQISMPGMMDTILNLGLNPATAVALARETEDLDFAADVFIRFCKMYAEIVLGASGDDVADAAVAARQGCPPAASPAMVMESIAAAAAAVLVDDVGRGIPDDPRQQLTAAIEAVFTSWNSPRAVTYRNAKQISHDLGTAVVVQRMVFGNLGAPSGTGVVFSRDPLTGVSDLYGEYLAGVQGEDVVAGTSTPQPLAEAAAGLPDTFARLGDHLRVLEDLYGDMVDVEFTIELGTLYLLQVRAGKRTAQAAVRVAADLLREGRLDAERALSRVSASQVREMERPCFEGAVRDQARAEGAVVGRGIGASPGHASGIAVVDADRAAAMGRGSGAEGRDVILIRPTTSPLDLHGMLAAQGIVTSRGGATSHAAVVARAFDTPCVVGCSDLEVDVDARRFAFAGRWFEEGASVAIDGSSGEVFDRVLPLSSYHGMDTDLGALLTLGDEVARCEVYGRATTVEQVERVRQLGGSGIAMRLGDILATSGEIEELLRVLVAQRETDPVNLKGFEQVVADVLAPRLEAAEGASVVLRAVDLVADDFAELLGADLIERQPRLALPVAIPALIAAQVAGLATAAARVGVTSPPQLTVRHVNDAGEAAEVKRIVEQESSGPGRVPVRAGVTLTSPRAVHMAADIAERCDTVWVEVRGLQAALFGYGRGLLKPGDPLDDYVRRHLLAGDPRTKLDGLTIQLMTSLAAARVSRPGCEFGVRLAGPVAEDVVQFLFQAGFRTYAVDDGEIRPARICLGQAAFDEGSGSTSPDHPVRPKRKETQ